MHHCQALTLLIAVLLLFLRSATTNASLQLLPSKEDASQYYRIGDLVLWGTLGFRTKFGDAFAANPGSIGMQYMRETNHSNDYDVLNKIVDRKIALVLHESKNDLKLPSINDLVIHIRLGDVIDSLNLDYLRPFEYYNSVAIMASDKVRYNISQVFLVGSNHLSNFTQRSILWMTYVENIFVKHGFKTVRIFDSANDYLEIDKHLIFMSKAHTFVPSCGGFSKVVRIMVERRSGKIVSPPIFFSRGLKCTRNNNQDKSKNIFVDSVKKHDKNTSIEDLLKNMFCAYNAKTSLDRNNSLLPNMCD